MAKKARWAPVPGFEKTYKVSADGRIVNLKTGRELAHGYDTVVLRGNGKSLSTTRRRVVMLAFGPPPPSPNARVCPKDGDGANAHLRNLEWRSVHDMRPVAKLTQRDVRDIRRLSGKATVAEIARKYNVSCSAISNIRSGRTWRTVG